MCSCVLSRLPLPNSIVHLVHESQVAGPPDSGISEIALSIGKLVNLRGGSESRRTRIPRMVLKSIEASSVTDILSANILRIPGYLAS